MSSSTNNACIVKGTGCSSPTNLPEFIDTNACLCGLLKSASELPDNGGITELWRCIGDASADVTHGDNGKWYNTTLPSEELSGINEPQNWGQNPPDTSQTFVLVTNNGQAAYQVLGSGGSPALIGADTDCNGKNDTTLSGMYYAKGKDSSHSASTAPTSSTSSASFASSTKKVSSATATSVSVASTSTTATPASTTSTESPSASAAAPKGDSSSAANHFSLKLAFLVGILFAPLASILM